MSNSKRFFTACCLFTLILTCIFSINAYAATNTQRIAGNNRYETSIKTSTFGWSTSKYAVLATGDNFPDALSAAPLAKKYNAPLILTEKDYLRDDLSSELKRLKVSEVFLVGGTGVISTNVEQQLNSMGILTTRLAGSNRYETSVKIAEKLGSSDKIVVTTGEDYSDALSVSPIAAKMGMPIILVSKNNMDSSTKAYLNGRIISKSYVIGDSSVISNNVAAKIPNFERILGNDKYQRNVNIINKFSSICDLSRVYIATGENFADALSGSAIAAKTSSVIILTGKLPSDVSKNFISGNSSKIKEIDVLGGDGAVSSSALKQFGNINEVQYMSDIIKPYYHNAGYYVNQYLTMGNNKYTNGYRFETTYSDGTYSFNLAGNYKSITGLIGLDDEDNSRDVTVNVYGDDKLIATYTLKAGSIAQTLNLNVSGITKLDFKISSGSDVDLVNAMKDVDGSLMQIPGSGNDEANISGYMSDITEPYYHNAGYYVNQYLTMGDNKYIDGYRFETTYSDGTYSFNLAGNYKSITGLIGLDDEDNSRDVTVRVYGDDKLITTYTLKAGSIAQTLNLNVSGITKLDFKISSGSDVDLINVMKDGDSSAIQVPAGGSSQTGTSQYMSDIIKPYYHNAGYYVNQYLTMGDNKYTDGYRFETTYSDGTYSFNLAGNYKSITGLIGLDDENNSKDVTVNVYGNDKLIATYTLKAGSIAQVLNLNVAGITKLDFKISSGSDVDLVNSILK
jgi:putative cell wall-binding protein/uncharacterized protein YlxW (UPF0749 family)